MMGVRPPAAERDRVHGEIARIGARISKAIGLRPLPPGRLRAVHADCDLLGELARPSYDVADPDSVVGRLRAAGLTFEEARGILLLMLLAGTLTTSAALPQIVGLVLDAGQWTLLRRDPRMVAQAIDEGLRYLAPVPATTRITQRDAIVGDRRIRRGTRIIILTGNLARDPRLFADPDRFDITRDPNPRARHLWYGAGPHFCFGFPLAQRQLHLVLDTLVRLPSPLRIVRRRPAWGAVLPAYSRCVVVADGSGAEEAG
jgi:cytochrome P450